MTHLFRSALLMLFLATVAFAQERTNPANQSKELGTVSWYRDFDQASKLAAEQNKAVLILFQEVPGCATCRNYGHNVLSHPLMAEAIADQFIPLAIYNNKGGKDKAILERYGEPSWNNPVVRIVDHTGKNLIARIAGNYSALALANGMKQALGVQKRAVPQYLSLLISELALEGESTLTESYFSMYCFWSGEKHLGENKAVVATEPGFMGGKEVVKVHYDSSLISEEALEAYAEKAQCNPVGHDANYRLASNDHHYYLKRSVYRYLPLTKAQKTKINSALGNGKAASQYLSPQQKAWLAELKNPDTKKQVLAFSDFKDAWKKREAY
ncbi:MAG: VPGUxxT family thioredoxin-like (seleno)protein, type 2 [Bacteroidia bacterium]